MLGVAVGDGLEPRARRRALLAAEPPMAGRLLADEVSGELDGDAADGARCPWSSSTTAPRPRSCACWSRPARTSRSCRTTPPPRRSCARPRRHAAGERPRRPGRRWTRTSSEVRGAGRRGAAAVRHLPRPPAARPGARARDVQAPVRPPRREPPGARARDGPRARDEPEPRLRDAHAGDGDGDVEVTHESLYDGTVEGLRLRGRPVWSMQFHPEASPGPHDAREQAVRVRRGLRSRGAAGEAR